jgi:hypothetical protein
MALESGTYISDLVATNPLGSDPISSSDDHLRLIKSTLKATFPNVAGAVTKTHAQLNNTVDKSGDTMSGPLTLPGAPTSALHAATKLYVDQAASGSVALIQSVYPIGSIYINASNSTNPATLLGFGTWQAFGAGRVPVGFNASDSLFNASEKTGGSKDAIVVSHTHTADTQGSHTHFVASTEFGEVRQFTTNVTGSNYVSAQGGSSGLNEVYNLSGVSTPATIGLTSSSGAHQHTITSTGSSGTNANMPPFITVYMWKRTA